MCCIIGASRHPYMERLYTDSLMLRTTVLIDSNDHDLNTKIIAICVIIKINVCVWVSYKCVCKIQDHCILCLQKFVIAKYDSDELCKKCVLWP